MNKSNLNCTQNKIVVKIYIYIILYVLRYVGMIICFLVLFNGLWDLNNVSHSQNERKYSLTQHYKTVDRTPSTSFRVVKFNFPGEIKSNFQFLLIFVFLGMSSAERRTFISISEVFQYLGLPSRLMESFALWNKLYRGNNICYWWKMFKICF